jgi:hypothetical protein
VLTIYTNPCSYFVRFEIVVENGSEKDTSGERAGILFAGAFTVEAIDLLLDNQKFEGYSGVKHKSGKKCSTFERRV